MSPDQIRDDIQDSEESKETTPIKLIEKVDTEEKAPKYIKNFDRLIRSNTDIQY